ncbi:hypothetical protein [Mesorhizobium sp. WSM4904]|uniref:hypothetical protein n=1 Tax=Mesorhizobium sp. WSM4904 TaxID=3038545 RepID=UPI0024182915|nr:hypothetical protein [Mesorhizobium sp. WSM4904]WFP62664.1 hypothetical protein QAZ47_30190 [Mesorhizobium sp. WSM4904]
MLHDLSPWIILGLFAWLIWGVRAAWKKDRQHKRATAYYRKVLEFYKTVHCTEDENDTANTLEWKREYAKLLNWYTAHDPEHGVKEYGSIWRKITAKLDDDHE